MSVDTTLHTPLRVCQSRALSGALLPLDATTGSDAHSRHRCSRWPFCRARALSRNLENRRWRRNDCEQDCHRTLRRALDVDREPWSGQPATPAPWPSLAPISPSLQSNRSPPKLGPLLQVLADGVSSAGRCQVLVPPHSGISVLQLSELPGQSRLYLVKRG